ncbi:snRNA-activating protein complex subunit 2 isoform X3 [Gasterosteus aculeatus]
MKPPPRKRTKPDRQLTPDPPPTKKPVRWQRSELKNVLKALQILYRKSAGNRDIDYAYLQKHVRTRSITEFQTLVDFLKDNILSLVSLKLKKRRFQEQSVRKPIDMWTEMASVIAGRREEAITSAFSQMLMVSSTEPCTLRNSDPPQTLPVRPIKVERPGTSTTCPVLLLKTPGPAQGPGIRPNRTQAVSVLNGQPHLSTTAGTSAASTPTPQSASTPSPALPSAQSPTTISASSPSAPPSSGPHAALSSSATGQAPVPSTAPPSSAATHLFSSPPAACYAKFGCTSKSTTKNNPRVFGAMGAVDFEKIYCYLSSIHQPKNDCHLTPMESAIMLDLLMSLPEELPLLDCKKLHKRLIQISACRKQRLFCEMYKFLSCTADSKMAQQMFEELKEGLCAGGDEQANREQSPAQAGGGKNPQPDEAESQSSGSTDAPGQSGDWVLCPPLNPFMVPLKLLMRK